MKPIGGIIVCGIMSFVFSTFLPYIDWQTKVSTLYAVSGIMFSIGMSIIVTRSFSKIKEPSAKRKLFSEYKHLRFCFITCFLIVSAIYMFSPGKDYVPYSYDMSAFKISWDYNAFLGLSLIFSILYFINNFISLQEFNQKLDEALDK